MRGFTFAEIAILFLIMAFLVALVLVLVPSMSTDSDSGDPGQAGLDRGAEEAGRNLVRSESNRVECMDNVRNIAGLLAFALPKRAGGANLILSLVAKGALEGERGLSTLFCPGDQNESLERAGGLAAYASLDVEKNGGYDALTSYAGRDQGRQVCRAVPGNTRLLVLVCDDSEDHHGGEGFVVGLTGGVVRFRDKVRDWELPSKTPVKVGPNSIVAELRCLRPD